MDINYDCNIRKPVKGKYKNLINYLLVYLLCAFSGINIFIESREALSLMFILLFVIFNFKQKKYDISFLILLFLILLITIAQFIIFEEFVLYSLLSYVVLFGYAYFTVKLIGVRFVVYYINFMLIMSAVSLFFYLPSLFSSTFLNYLSHVASYSDPILSNNFFIYTVRNEIMPDIGLIRNSGFAYEPGMFVCFLIIALIFNTMVTKKLWNLRNVIFLICILTTFSTAGYISSMFFILSYYCVMNHNRLKFIIIPLLLLSMYLMYINVDFLGDKIYRQIEISGYWTGSYWHGGRVGSALVDMQTVGQFPLTGVGRSLQTRYGGFFTIERGIRTTHRTNGVLDLFAVLGLPIGFYYFYRLFKSLKIITISLNNMTSIAMVAFLTIILFGMGQVLFFRPFFVSLLFIYINYLPRFRSF